MKTSLVRFPLPQPGQPLVQQSPDTRPGFKEVLKGSINDVNQYQHQAHQAMEELSTGKSSNLHETMVSIQKAEISFRMMVQVRNKVMEAYQTVMRMQV
jgi:flagellar hook-basal body complex protein FliE